MNKPKINKSAVKSYSESSNASKTYSTEDKLKIERNLPHNPSKNNVITFEQPEMRMSKAAYTNIIYEICSRPIEAGGILLGPVDTNSITKFYYDSGGTCSGVTYTPDYLALGKLMKEVWMPSGIDMKGFVHSHPGRFDCHSQGDLEYISRLLQKNPDMDIFFAPIIIPSEYRMRPLCVLRKNPGVSVEAKLVLF